jgi:hypothetical protein
MPLLLLYLPFCDAHVCFWPKADIASCGAHARFQG